MCHFSTLVDQIITGGGALAMISIDLPEAYRCLLMFDMLYNFDLLSKMRYLIFHYNCVLNSKLAANCSFKCSAVIEMRTTVVEEMN